MVDVVPRLAHPVAGRDAATALRALGAETSASKQTAFSRIDIYCVRLAFTRMTAAPGTEILYDSILKLLQHLPLYFCAEIYTPAN